MSTLSERFSAVRSSQLEAQMNFFQNYTAKALEGAQKILALNLSLSRASIEKSSAVVAELLEAKDPRDLAALTKRTQESIGSLLAYNRALLAIATGTGAATSEAVVQVNREVAALALVKPALAPEPAVVPEPAVAPEPAAAPEPELAAPEFVAPVAEPELIAPVAEPVVAAPAATATPAAPPQAKVKAVAKAVSKVAPKAAPAKPAAAPVPAAKPVVVAGIKPVTAARPPAPVSGKPAAAQQQLDLPAAKSKNKKSK